MKPLLPAPVLAETAERKTYDTSGEARESTKGSLAANPVTDADSRGGQSFMSQNKNKPQSGPVEPAQQAFESNLIIADMVIGEKQILDASSAIIGALLRIAGRKKYLDGIVNTLTSKDEGNPMIPYLKTVAFFAQEIKKAVDKDPQFQAGLEQAQRRAFMEQMTGGGFEG